MCHLRPLIFAICSFLFATFVTASPSNPISGVEFVTLETPQNTDSGKRIEVIEFFGYFCPHCYAFDSVLDEWVKRQGDKVAFKRIHIAFGESTAPQQRFYFALEAMGKSDEMHKKIFSTIHVERKALSKEDLIIEFVVKQGIDRQKFLDSYNSFSVQSKVRRATQLQGNFKIDSVPMIAIDGRFITSPSHAQAGMPPGQSESALHSNLVKIMDALLDKAGKEHSKESKVPNIPAIPAQLKVK